MTTTPSNYTPSEVRTALWLRHPRVFAYLDRVDPDVYSAVGDLFAHINFRNNWRISDEMVSDAESFMEEEAWIAPNEPAYPFDVRDIPNGHYRLDVLDEDDDTIDYFDYQIYTVTRGRWAGRRVIKHRPYNGSYKAFAFLNADGSWTLWSRFRSEAHKEYVRHTPMLLTAITEQYQAFNGRVQDSDEWRVLDFNDRPLRLRLVNMACRICNEGIDREQGFLTQLCYGHAPDESYGMGLIEEIRNSGGIRSGNRTQNVLSQRRLPLAMCEITQSEVQ